VRTVGKRYYAAGRKLLRRNAEADQHEDSYFKTLNATASDRYLDLFLRVDHPTLLAPRRYQYSKLYYATERDDGFHESRVICFQPVFQRRFEAIRLALPEQARGTGSLRIRLDGLPYTPGGFEVEGMTLSAGADHPERTRLADLAAHRQWVREQVIESETVNRSVLPHYPESFSIELTGRCNLRCPHCSSHGTLELHQHHNRLPEISADLLDRVAHEVFPHITALSLVGRGEPTFASDEIWDRCMALVEHYNVKLSCVSNGHFIPKRFTRERMPFVDEVCVSVDGNTAQTHKLIRGGSSLQTVLDNIEYFHRARTEAGLARRPKLTIYWTLMANNVHELPDFVRRIAALEPDYFAIRHLVVFHEKDLDLALLGRPSLTNPHLEEAYAELSRLGIEFEGPPLMLEGDAGRVVGGPSDVRVDLRRSTGSHAARLRNEQIVNGPLEPAVLLKHGEPCTWMHRSAVLMSDGQVITCGKHYGEEVGFLEDGVSFMDIWNGPAMTNLRATYRTPNRWKQCEACWIRELEWHSQRRAHDDGREYSLNEPKSFSPDAFDYRDFDSY